VIDKHRDIDVAHGGRKATMGKTADRVRRHETITKDCDGLLASPFGDHPTMRVVVGKGRGGIVRKIHDQEVTTRVGPSSRCRAGLDLRYRKQLASMS
jgi:hypothetical protein